MANAEGINPSRREIERQLDRMLAHPLFRAKTLQAEMFEFLVTSGLNGVKLEELDIFLKFYPKKKPQDEGSEVRTNVTYVRKMVREYYGGDGKDDPVIIRLPVPERTLQPNGKYKLIKRPPGGAYKPEFSYNPRSARAKDLAIANYLLSGGPAQVEQGLWQLEKTFREDPNQPDMVLSTVEAVGGQLLLGGVFPDDVKKGLITEGFAWIDRIAAQVPDYWRVPMVRALLHYYDGDLDKAGKEFEIALTLDRQHTISRGWYTQYLFATGRQDDAVHLMGLNADERVDNAQAHALHGIYLTQAQKYDEAEKAFAQSFALDRNCWPAHFGMTRLCTATGREHQSKEHAKRLEALVEPAEYEDLKRRLDSTPPQR
jgi:tetratricopeptide (TPR) repeat protein